MVPLQTTPSFCGSVRNYKLLEVGMLMALAWIRCPHLDQLPQTKGQGYYVEEGGPLHFRGAMESWVARATDTSSISMLLSSNLPIQMSLFPSAKPRTLSPSLALS